MSLDDALDEKDGVFGAAVEEALLARLNLKLGDIIRIGEASFALRTILVSEPDRLAAGVGLGPRALFSQAALEATNGSARLAGQMDGARHGAPGRRAGQCRRSGFHG